MDCEVPALPHFYIASSDYSRKSQGTKFVYLSILFLIRKFEVIFMFHSLPFLMWEGSIHISKLYLAFCIGRFGLVICCCFRGDLELILRCDLKSDPELMVVVVCEIPASLYPTSLHQSTAANLRTRFVRTKFVCISFGFI